jgi:hypothetical protein
MDEGTCEFFNLISNSYLNDAFPFVKEKRSNSSLAFLSKTPSTTGGTFISIYLPLSIYLIPITSPFWIQNSRESPESFFLLTNVFRSFITILKLYNN